MNDAVTISTPTLFGTQDSLLSPLHLTNTKESNLENWHPHLTVYRPIPHKNSTKMPSRTDNNGSAEPLNASRWRVNSSGQLVSSEPGWDLADEIVRLKIGDVTGQNDNGRTRTPPKSVAASNAVAQMAESSPLDSSSAPSVDSSPDGSTRAKTIPHSRETTSDDEAAGSPPKDQSNDNGRSQQWDAMSPVEQPSYPSLMAQAAPRQQGDYRSPVQGTEAANGDDLQIDYSLPHRNYNPIPQGSPNFANGRPAPANVPPVYRQPPPTRNYTGHGMVPASTGMMPYLASHQSSSSLGNGQQLYDMMLPGAPENHPAIARLQQQHNVYPRSHQRSISDSSNVPDPVVHALMTGNIPVIYPGMAPIWPAPPYGAGADPYGRVTEAQALAAAARLQQSYNAQQSYVPLSVGPSPVGDDRRFNASSNGPSANNRKLGLYKTELCRSWEEKGTCRYGAKCQFAHGEEELRTVQRHPKYKTEICRTFWVSGSCPYGKRCCFIHTELPQGAAGAPPPAGADGNANGAAQRPDARARSGSTNSDPSDAPVSLLARIKRENAPTTPVDVNSASGLLRPGALRVDTSALNPEINKQNKSAYPTFPGNNIMFSQPEPVNKRSSPAPAQGPVTAGPDFGRHLSARLNIVGSNEQRPGHRHTPSNSSQQGTEGLTPANQGHQYSLSGDGGRINGHVRGSSAGNWGAIARAMAPSPAQYQSSASPVGERPMNSPWTTTELVPGGGKKTAWP
ncbi:hypothetical protein K523DRAFT_278691 [Schizophyllum commune Tattone D]|nr:hypothetical protein K523DRAFT_278691 [Schizophyllum commune Tattone D]